MSEAAPKTSTRIQIKEIGAEEAGQRIDNFLLRHLKKAPKSLIYRILRTGQVRVDGRRAKPDYRLQAGDKLRIPPVHIRESEGPPRPGKDALERLRAAVVYEDAGLLVLDKPAGMAVHGGSGLSFGVIEALRVLRPEARFLELVHRLDRETSGCLMIAKRRSVLRGLHDALREGQVEKRYLALVRGAWPGGARDVSAPLHKRQLRGGERMVTVSEAGKPSRTRFIPMEVYREASFMEVSLGTGRTHQIRVHAAHIGHPVAGDEKYGDEAFNKAMREHGLKRLFLHAHSLAFVAPHSGEALHIDAPLPPALRSVLNSLEGNDQD